MDIPRTYNPGPEMPLASDPAHVSRAKFEAAEVGTVLSKPPQPSTMVRCPLPSITSVEVLGWLEASLIHQFGGFSAIPYWGGWRNPAEGGDGVVESGIIFEVSFSDGPDREQRIGLARTLFLQAGHSLKQEWVRIEVHRIETRCGFVGTAPNLIINIKLGLPGLVEEPFDLGPPSLNEPTEKDRERNRLYRERIRKNGPWEDPRDEK